MRKTSPLFLTVLSLTSALLLQGCFKVTITKSSERSADPGTIRLSEDVSITSLGAVDINGTDFFPSGVRIDAPGKTIYVDPVRVDGPRQADVIFLTHAHPDHLSLPDIEKLSGPDTVVVGPASAAKKLPGREILKVAPGDAGSIDGVRYEAVPAYNKKRVFLWLKAHPKSARNAGYVLTVGGKRVYCAGDTDFIPEMNDLSDIALAMLPVGGDNLTMDPAEAAAAANAIRPEIAVPVHYTTGDSERVESFRDLVNGGITVRVFPGSSD